LFRIFQISLENYFKIKFQLEKHLRLQPSEIEALPYYELEYTIENLIEDLKKRNKENDEQQNDTLNNSAHSDSMRSINSPKIPNMGKIPSIPRGGVFKMPKY